MTEDIQKSGTENAELENGNLKRTTPSWSGVGSFFSAYREPQENPNESAVVEVVPDAQNLDVRGVPYAPLVRSETVPMAPPKLNERTNERSVAASISSIQVGQPDAQTGAAAVMAREKPQANVQEAAPNSLFPSAEAANLRARWDAIQLCFIDEPRHCVEQADSLVAETMRCLAESFAREREGLEDRWKRGGTASTEDLRQAVRQYRSFFGRLVQL